MKTLLILLFTFASVSSMASDYCIISYFLYDPVHDVRGNTQYPGALTREKWEDCFTAAATMASKEHSEESLVIGRKFVAVSPNVSMPEHYSESALVKMGYGKWEIVTAPAMGVYTWRFDDGYFFGSTGKVTKYSDPSRPEKGNVAVDEKRESVSP